MIQEHFRISERATGFFRKIFTDHNVHFKKAQRKEGELRGRASGGMVQMSCKKTDMNLTPISSNSYRIQAQKLRIGSKTILWFNAYLPIDSENTDELEKILAEMELIIETEEITSVMIGGDLNYDPVRSSASTKMTSEWIDKMNMKSVWENHPIDFTHHHIDHSSTANLDHFLVTSDLTNVIISAGVFHHPEGHSRHDPIWMTFGDKFGQFKTKYAKGVNRKKPGWNKATLEDTNKYRTMLENKLEDMTDSEGLSCDDTKCQETAHGDDIDNRVLEVLIRIVEASYTCIPIVGRDERIPRKKQEKITKL